MRKRFACMAIAAIFLSVLPAFSQQSTTDKPGAPEPVSYSTIVEADGFAFLADDKTLNEIREQAKANAKKEALERAQTYIKSMTKVENYVLTYDLVESEAEGLVKVLESKDLGVQGDNRYRYWIRAEIQYLPVTPGQSKIEKTIAQNPKAPLTVQLWTENPVYKDAEEMTIFLKGNKDFYARIAYVDVDGQIVQLLPNEHRAQNFFKGGVTYRIPDAQQGDQFALTVSPPFGVEQIVVYASTAPQGEVELQAATRGLYAYRGSLASLGQRTRGLKITSQIA